MLSPFVHQVPSIQSPFLNRRRGAGGSVVAFSPASLYSSGAQGIWLDPSDVANLAWRRNLLTYSEQFDNAYWTKTGIVSTTTANGLSTTTENTTTSAHLITRLGVTTASIGTVVSVQMQISAGTRRYVVLAVGNGVNDFRVNVDTQNWSLADNSTAGSTLVSSSISEVGGGVYKVTMSGRVNTGTTAINITIAGSTTSAGDFSYAGTNATIITGKVQLELGPSATDYQRITDVNTEVLERFPTATMFSDRAGTTAVTTPGTVVGLRLDKSKGLALGAELVTNGTFDSGTTGWTAGSAAGSVATIAVSSGELIVTNSVAGQFGKAFQAITCVVGKSYQVSGLARVVSASTGRAALYLVGSTGTFIGPASNEISGSTLSPVSLVFLATATTHYIAAAVGGVGANAGATFGFDNISVRELAGNHAVAPTDAARPTYGVEPKGGRRNLLTWSEDFGNAAWTKIRSTTTATKISSDATATQIFPQALQSLTKAASSITYTFSVEIKEAELRYAGVTIQDAAAANGIFTHTDTRDAANLNQGTFGTGFTLGSVSRTLLGDGYVRVVVTGTTNTGTTISVGVQPSKNSTFSSTSYILGEGMLVRNAQLELGSTVTPYQKVTTEYDVTEAGVPTRHYVAYGGAHSMSTAAIDFTATDKMSVFAGVRKLSTTDSRIVELSVDPTSNAGAFWLSGPQNTYEAFSRGTAAIAANQLAIATGFVSPTINVVTSTHDIAGDLTTIRVNGAASASATGDKGTGNFGNYPLFFGRRNNAGTLNFNGRDYGIIIVGKTASPTEITTTENWLADKTGFSAPVIVGVPTIGVS